MPRLFDAAFLQVIFLHVDDDVHLVPAAQRESVDVHRKTEGRQPLLDGATCPSVDDLSRLVRKCVTAKLKTSM